MGTLPHSLRKFQPAHHRTASVLLLALLCLAAIPCSAQMVSGLRMEGFPHTLGIEQPATDYTVQQIGVRVGTHTMVNLLLPGETPLVTLHFVNRAATPLQATGHLEVIRYRTSVPVGDIWKPVVSRIGEPTMQPITVSIPSRGEQDVVVQPAIGDTFGGYALVVDLPGHGRLFAASFARTIAPDEGRVQFPTYALDAANASQMNEGVFAMFQRLGVKGMRLLTGFAGADAPVARDEAAKLDQYLTWAKRFDVTVMLTLQGHAGPAELPLGEVRPWLTDDGVMRKTKSDYAWLPSADMEFEQYVHNIARQYGWPRGNVNAMELWNEPWESTSISGWGADIPRYQEIFTHMAQGIEQARQQDGTRVLIGGACSSTNARDKLFADGSDKFLKWMDYISIHYQPMDANPVLVPEWVHRKGEYGPMRVWDTESWIANSEDRFAGVIASMRAQGQSRTAGIYGGNVYQSENIAVDGQTHPLVQVWAPAAAVAAAQKFIGQRDFDTLLFGKGLPWVFAFKGPPANPDDGTLVVVGDLGKIYDPGLTLFRSVAIAPDAHLVLDDPEHVVRLFDFYGNPLPDAGRTASIPLDGRGFFVRSSGQPGSFARALAVVRAARIVGIEPVEIVAHDLTAPLAAHPTMTLELTNVLNRPVQGTVTATSPGLTLGTGSLPVQLAPHETRSFELPVSGAPAPDNLYPVHIAFNAGSEGTVAHDESLHVNQIAHRTIKVDGDLADWQGVLPEVLPGAGIETSLSEKAYLPYAGFDARAPEGFSTVYLAYDDQFFYFAAKIADTTPDEGTLRFETRDDAPFFYPDTVTDPSGAQKTWPQGVRHFSYRKGFEIPSASKTPHDTVQIAFNVLDRKPWLPNPPGTIPHFITYFDTDYEFALNKVAPAFGGGVEIWRLYAPRMPRKSFYSRQPKSPIDGGPVKDGQLSITYRNGARIVEAAIPWHEIPEVRARILAGRTIKFTCRINDNKSTSRELATGRSVSKMNSLTFHNDWQTHWSNELQFGAETQRPPR